MWIIQIQEVLNGQGPQNHQVTQPTTAEQSLISYMQEAFGPLASLLLTGYRESEIKQSRAFTILTDNSGVKTRHSITLRAGDASGLPHRREPLILLALLKLSLIGDQCGAIRSPSDAVSRLLGWEESEETHHEISAAIRKYFNISYTRTDDIAYTFPDRSEKLIGMYRLIRYCEFGTDAVAWESEDSFEGIAVEFSANVVKEVFERRLFRINWPAIVFLGPADSISG
jgi:hypothetical protein